MNQLATLGGVEQNILDHSRPNKPDSSRVDLGRVCNFTTDAGMIVPFDCFPVYPDDVVDIDVTMALDTLPLVAPSLTQYKVVTHWYYMKARDCWKGYKTTATRGRSGNITNLEIPRINTQLPLSYGLNSQGTNYVYYDTVTGKVESESGSGRLKGLIWPLGSHSLISFLGVPSERQGWFTAPSSSSNDFSLSKAYLPYTFYGLDEDYDKNLAYNTAVTTKLWTPPQVNALPFVMYQSICKNNYVNQNLLQDNKSLFPDEGDDDWILPYNATVTNFIDVAKNADVLDTSIVPEVKYHYDGVYHDDDTVTRLDQLRYCQFDDDYFTTALPWLQRGEVQTLTTDLAFDDYKAPVLADLPVDEKTVGIEVSAYKQSGNPVVSLQSRYGSSLYSNLWTVNGSGSGSSYSGSSTSDTNRGRLYANISGLSASSSFTINQFREFVAMSVWQERNARVNGSYNQMIYQHWHVDPQSEEHLPVYIGGTGDYMNFDSIVQNSASTSSSPLGTQAGYGKLPTSQSKVCQSFRCSDYGYIMGIMIVRPVTYYQQGIERHMLPGQNFSTIIYPEFQSLAPEPIFEGEIYAKQSEVDNAKLFAYQERYTYAKIRQNVNRGLFQCNPNKDIMFSAMTQARWFDTKPQFSYQFTVMCPENVRRDHLAFPSMPMFRAQVLTSAFVNRKLAYLSTPNTFGF